MTRNTLIEALIKKQESIIDNLEDSVERYQTASDIDEQETREPEDFARQTEAKDMQLRFEKLVREARVALDFLSEQREQIHERIEKGTLVKTDFNWFFLGVSMPLVELEGLNLVSISDQAPVYKDFVNKKTGDHVLVGEKTHEILEII